MNTRAGDTDSFDRALIAALRDEVVVRARAPRTAQRQGRRIAAGVVAAMVAGVVAFVSMTTAPAYAVQRQGDGDIVITIRKMTDATGLERDLAANGIDAVVNYGTPSSVPPGPITVGGPSSSACGTPAHPALTTNLSPSAYVITIPAHSALRRADSVLRISTEGDVQQSIAGLVVTYRIDGVECGIGTLSTGPSVP